MDELERHYTPGELAELLSCSTETIRRAAVSGELRSVRLGSSPSRRFPVSAVREWLGLTREQPLELGRVVQLDRRARGA